MGIVWRKLRNGYDLGSKTISVKCLFIEYFKRCGKEKTRQSLRTAIFNGSNRLIEHSIIQLHLNFTNELKNLFNYSPVPWEFYNFRGKREMEKNFPVHKKHLFVTLRRMSQKEDKKV